MQNGDWVAPKEKDNDIKYTPNNKKLETWYFKPFYEKVINEIEKKEELVLIKPTIQDWVCQISMMCFIHGNNPERNNELFQIGPIIQ